jgi:hypothetical protein
MLIVFCIRENHGGKRATVLEARARAVKNGKWRAMVPRHSVTAATSDRKAESNCFRGSVVFGWRGMSIALCFCTSPSIEQIQAKEDGRF